MPGVGKLLKQAQKMQKKMQEVQEQLAAEETEVSAGGGAVTVRITLQQELKAIKLDPEFLKEDPEMVEETITEAVREAISKSKAQSEERMGEVTSGMGMPGLPGMM